jgi:hypothetical protein
MSFQPNLHHQKLPALPVLAAGWGRESLMIVQQALGLATTEGHHRLVLPQPSCCHQL